MEVNSGENFKGLAYHSLQRRLRQYKMDLLPYCSRPTSGFRLLHEVSGLVILVLKVLDNIVNVWLRSVTTTPMGEVLMGLQTKLILYGGITLAVVGVLTTTYIAGGNARRTRSRRKWQWKR